MEKVEIKIVEDKFAKNNAPYRLVDLIDGRRMSCWNSDLFKLLIPGRCLDIAFEVKGDYTMITNAVDSVDSVDSPVEPINDLGKAIKAATRQSVKGLAYEKDPVGLSVEMFGILEHGQDDTQEVMRVAILRVKQAQEAFN